MNALTKLKLLNLSMDLSRSRIHNDAARWVTVNGGTNVETGQGTGRHFQIDENGRILKGGGAVMEGKTFREAFSDDNKQLTERQKLSRRITEHAAKQFGGDKRDFTRLTNKGAAGKSSDWHAKEFLKSGNVPSEYQEKQEKDPPLQTQTGATSQKATPEQISALETYQGTSFESINTELRYDKPSAKNKEVVKKLDAMANNTVSEPLYKGMDSDFVKELKAKYKITDLKNLDELKQKLVGKSIKDKSFSSTSKNMHVAADFARDKGTGMTAVIQIDGDKQGIDMAEHLDNPRTRKEQEFLLKRSSNLEIKDIKISKTGKLIIVATSNNPTTEQEKPATPQQTEQQNDLTTKQNTTKLSSTSQVGAATGESKMSISTKKNTANSELELARQEYKKASDLMTSADSHEKMESARQEMNAAGKKLNTAEERVRILGLAEKVEGLKVMSVAGLGSVLTANGKEPFKLIGSGDAERVMSGLGITGKVVKRGNSKFIVPDGNAPTDKSLIVAAKGKAAEMKAQPLHQMINKRADGTFGVKIPFPLKDEFKSKFSSAKWDGTAKEWTVGKLSSAKLNDWLQDKIPMIEESAAKKSAFEAKKAEMHVLTGNTYVIKDQLKEKFGAVYDGDSKQWRVPQEHKEAAQAFVNEHNAPNKSSVGTVPSYSGGGDYSGRYSWNTSPEEAARAGIDWFDLEG